jgi:hypothetical protein
MRGIFIEAVAAVVVTVTEPVPLGVPAVTVIVPPPAAGAQVGKCEAPAGLVVNAQLSVTVPV